MSFDPNPPPPPPLDHSAVAAAPIGTVLAERYYIHSLIGEGGMGRVYAGEHVLMHKRVAVKVLHKELTTLPDVVSRFEREAMAAANIDHPNVAGATDFGHLPDGSVFLVLEYVQGISLRSEIAEGPFAVVRALHIARQIASALASAHARGIVHRDLKPENVMLVEKAGDPDFVKVLDFGIAKVPIQEVSERGSVLPGEIITKVGMIFGTPEYMAPEQAVGQDADGRADQYALGVILFEMLTGIRPFRSGTQVGMLGQQLRGAPPKLNDVAPHLVTPEGVDELIARMLAADRERRFDTTIALVEAIEELLLLLQPSSLLRGSRPDASQGPLVYDGPISARARHPELPAQSRAPAESEPSRGQWERWVDTGYAALPRPLRRIARGLPAQLGIALLGGLLVGALGVGVGLVVQAAKTTPAMGSRRSAPSGPLPTASAAMSAAERAPASSVALARASGASALDRLAEQFPKDHSVVIEIAKTQFAAGEYSASVGSVGRALDLDKATADNAEVATLLWKAVQKRESSESAFRLLEGAMGARGADILYDLVTTEGVRRELRDRANEFFTSGRFRGVSATPLVVLIDLKLATSCEERKQNVERAINVGDERFVPVLEALSRRDGCGKQLRDDCNACLRSDERLQYAIDVIKKRSDVP